MQQQELESYVRCLCLTEPGFEYVTWVGAIRMNWDSIHWPFQTLAGRDVQKRVIFASPAS